MEPSPGWSKVGVLVVIGADTTSGGGQSLSARCCRVRFDLPGGAAADARFFLAAAGTTCGGRLPLGGMLCYNNVSL